MEGSDHTTARHIICGDPEYGSRDDGFGGVTQDVCPLRQEGGPCLRLNRCIIGRPNLTFDDAGGPNDPFRKFEQVNLRFGEDRTPGYWVLYGAGIGVLAIAAFLILVALGAVW